MDEIHAWREHFPADVVSLLRHQVGDVCGTAYVMTSLSKSFESQAFSVVQQQCAVPTLTFAHEVGHNQGACHAPGDEGCGMGLYPHSFGHRFVGDTGTTRRTVMAYAPGVRTNHFSNPARLYDGVATGTSERNNAATLNSSAWTVANFRLSTLPTIARVSNAPDGSPGTFGSNDPSVTPDGAYLVFASGANNLVPGDTNNATDIFVRDMATGAVDRVSVSSAGGQTNDVSGEASISDDGRFVAFYSVATNLVPDDTNGYWDIFVHDRATGETTRVNLGPDGAQGNGHSRYPSISGDGRFIAYRSSATNLVPGGSTAGHVFVFDRIAGETSIVSRSSDGEPGDAPSDTPSVSYDGRYIAFHSHATNLVPDDTNGRRDVFVRDTVLGTTVRASLPVGGENDDRAGEYPRITGSGRFVAYESVRSTNRQARLYDALLGTSTIESLTVTGAPAGNGCQTPQASEDGRYVVYTSASDNIVYGDTNVKRDIFVRDRWAAVNYRVSTTYLSEQADGHSDFPTMTADGSVIVFRIEAQNLIPEGGNGRVQLYAHAWRECVRCPADMNADTVVNSIDFIVFLNAYSASEPRADFNGDTVVNTLDFIAFLNAYVAGCD
ncbi:MAG TPA: GC-type dockerin domain-anchored protein [Phycisphaerales bacterium]|nr:GC-type dockerin domain-anchored protein [Phycisphaerales bacterium]